MARAVPPPLLHVLLPLLLVGVTVVHGFAGAKAGGIAPALAPYLPDAERLRLRESSVVAAAESAKPPWLTGATKAKNANYAPPWVATQGKPALRPSCPTINCGMPPGAGKVRVVCVCGGGIAVHVGKMLGQ